MLIALPNAFGDAATNMALDAALLESLPEGLAAFRHYGWLEPAATFGYAQAYESVASVYSGGQSSTSAADRVIPPTLCRRLTGGGIVDHRNDWTYALVLHASLPAASIPATTLYEKIHRAISQTLDGMGIENQLAPCPKACAKTNPIMSRRSPEERRRNPISNLPSQCFVTPAANDVLRADGQKIAGAAMKRSRHCLLIQGSIDRAALPEDFDYIGFQAQLIEAFATALDLPIGSLEDIRPLFKSERIEREKQRFASAEWNQRR